MALDGAFSHERYFFRRKVFRFFGGEFSICDPNGNTVLYSEQKSFKLKEDIRVYSDGSMSHELLTIKARQVLDFGATYDVVDPQSDVAVGALRRKGLKSIAKDEWLFLDPQGQEIGMIQEDRLLLAILRRLFSSRNLSFLFPQKYTLRMGGQPVAHLKQHFSPFVLKYTLDLSEDHEERLDRRLAIAAGIMLCAIERRQ
jgi:uncharacterized protein YxjI